MVWLRIDVVEGKVGVVDEVGVGVALDDGEPLRHAGVDPAWHNSMPLPSAHV